MQDLNVNNSDILNNKHNEDLYTAINIYENDYSHEDLMNFLKNGSVVEKQIAVLKLESINSDSDAEILMNNLTGCDGKIREAVSYRLKEFITQKPEFFTKYIDTFLDAIIDINGNICRNTISAITALKINTEFSNKFSEKLSENTYNLAQLASKFDIQDGKYKINKQIFKLYWYMETIYNFLEFIKPEMLKNIILCTKDADDYTIREKTAKILSQINNPHLKEIKSKLKNDENYYVRRF